uniref:PAP/OAS1 substrate-binding-related domain-containing protein n=1 Tax=Cajanus cajan TaxID=3821 RepID=A0A151T5M8_CAJCA|nr:hypothetical protein KK1_016894 [Cajanus cajan]
MFSLPYKIEKLELKKMILEEGYMSRDKLVKSTHFILINIKYPIKRLTKLYIGGIVRLHGIPTNIVFLPLIEFTYNNSYHIDRLVAKDHLFKRSIILIKALCYYKSRVLGAHHGLISTYALETLVLYIFHQFHVSLDGPLAVLYRFLDYFSKFDWDNYCVSLKEPISKSSLPNVVAKVPENGGNTLLTEGFIRSCVESFSVPSRGSDLNLRAFPQKHLNIIDPLKENNNLGRSVK